ncbi:MAG: TonB-dependent receptor, partial [Bacteroidales bacterium]|nr:TonB-dependent receptor [Bacteroidales bacterium]
MKKIVIRGGSSILVLFSMFLSLIVSAQESAERTSKLDSIVVEAYRAGKNTPVSYSDLDQKEIRKTSPVNSVPMMLGLMPSVVVSTEGGNGLGYSSMRIRGSEGSRINVTLNGVALNDSESQELFWVNIPSFSSILQDIQIQRGVGTSVNGPGAFGASVNMRTLLSSSKPYATADLGIASYNSYMSTFGAGSGITDKGYTFDIRFSKNRGDGYIERAGTDLTSLFFTAGKLREKSSVRFNYIMGKQRSGITWEGISREQMETDRRYNPAGLWYDQAGNERFYDNETDNYTQHHLQLVYTRLIRNYIKWGTTLHFTKGDGYYENYKYDKKFSAYGLDNQLIGETQYKKS